MGKTWLIPDAENCSADELMNWWTRLSPDERDWILREHPEVIEQVERIARG